MSNTVVLGDWEDHMMQMDDIVAGLIHRLGRAHEVIDADGYRSTVIAATEDESSVKLAWVETRRKDSSDDGSEVSHTLVAREGERSLGQWPVPTYNPVFGCDVGWLQWCGDRIAVVYREKQGTAVALFDARSRGEPRMQRISSDWNVESGVLYFVSKEPGLIESCRLRDLEMGTPIEIAAGEKARQFVERD